jgi:hypothetical protein
MNPPPSSPPPLHVQLIQMATGYWVSRLLATASFRLQRVVPTASAASVEAIPV